MSQPVQDLILPRKISGISSSESRYHKNDEIDEKLSAEIDGLRHSLGHSDIFSRKEKMQVKKNEIVTDIKNKRDIAIVAEQVVSDAKTSFNEHILINTEKVHHELESAFERLGRLENGCGANRKKGIGATREESHSPDQSTTQGSKRVIRRSIMQIESDLKARLQNLREDPAELEALRQRIEEQKHSKRHKQDIIERNKSASKSEDIQTKHKEVEEHRADVRKRKEKMERVRQAQLNERLKQKDLVLGLSKTARIAAAERNRKHAHLKKWYILVMVGSRIQAFYDALYNSQREEMEKIRIFQAAILIQKTWRAYKKRQREEELSKASQIIGRYIMKLFVPKIRLQLKHTAADLLVKFFRESGNVNSLMKVIKTYRYKVIVCQRAIRSYLTIEKHQMNLLLTQWDKVEMLWWQQRMNPTDSSKNQKALAKKKKDSAPSNTDTFHIPLDIKTRLLKDSLRKRKKDYRDKYTNYRKRLLEWSQKEKQKREMMSILMKDGASKEQQLPATEKVEGLSLNANGMPFILTFRTLLSQKEMIELVERGFDEATTSKPAVK